MIPVNNRGRSRRHATAPDMIAETLRDEILRGAIAPGEALRQEELADRFQVSRIPVRDALLRLEVLGLVHVYPNRGAFVISLSADEVRETYDLRILLEGDILERAVPRMTADDWRRIDAAHAEATRTAGTPDWVDGDWTFHRALYEPAGRSRQLAMIEQLRDVVARSRVALTTLPVRTADWLADHDAILQASRARSSVAARKRLEAHLRAAADIVLSQYSASGA